MRGGARPGAGRPRGSMKQEPKLEPASPEGELPLGYMLRIMRDGNVDPKRRDAMARAAISFYHGRIQQASRCPENPNDAFSKTLFTEFFQVR